MPRVLAVLLLLQLIAQASGLVYAAPELACAEQSSDQNREQSREQDGEDCTPDCQDCLCCAHQRNALLPPGGRSPLLKVRPLIVRAVPLLLSEPEPGEIMHVPRSRPALDPLPRA